MAHVPDRPVSAARATRGVVFDGLSGAIWLLSAAAAAAAVVLPINQLTQPGGQARVALTHTAEQQALAGVQGVPAGSWLEFAGNLNPMSLHVSALDWPLRLLSEAGNSVLLGCLAVAGWLLSGTLRSIRSGTPFEPGNPRRLRLIGLLVIVGGVGSQILDALARSALVNVSGAANPSGPIQAAANVDLTWIFVGLVTLALAEAFVRGGILSDDVAGLI